MHHLIRSAAASAVLCSPCALASGICDPGWLPYFRAGDLPEPALAMQPVDGGVLIGGDFNSAGPLQAPGVTVWMEPVGFTLASGPFDHFPMTVHAVALFDEDGDGPAAPSRIVGGLFLDAPNDIEGVARLTPSGWERLGALRGRVTQLTVMEYEGAPALFAMGSFTTAADASGVDHPVERIVRWTGDDWVSLSGVVEPTAIGVYDTGDSQTLYASGRFTEIVTEYRLARWDGSTWILAPGALQGGHITTMCSFDPGPGVTRLYLGGSFQSVLGEPATGRFAAWNGSDWQGIPLGITGGPNPGVTTFAIHDDGDGPRLYIGGSFTNAGALLTNNLVSYRFNDWRAEGSSAVNGVVRALASSQLPDGSPYVLVGGDFTYPARHLAQLKDGELRPLGDGPRGDDNVQHLETITFQGETELYMSGPIQAVDGGALVADNVVKWNGAEWTLLSDDTTGAVSDFIVYPINGVDRLIAGGAFFRIGGVNANRLARFNGTSWSEFAGGANGAVRAMAIFDDGSGPELYACGEFTQIGGVNAERIAKYDGSTWTPLGTGLNQSGLDMMVFDDGNGPALYVGGNFSGAGGVPGTNTIARWDGKQWSAMNLGMQGSFGSVRVNALTTYDSGDGPRLVAAGSFTLMGDSAGVVMWDGKAWSRFGPGLVGEVRDVEVADIGGKSLMMVVGPEQTNDGLILNDVGIWDGESWSALGGGLVAQNIAVVPYSVAAFDLENGPAFVIGGQFSGAGPLGVQNLAAWGCTTAPVACPGDTNGDNLVDFADLNTVLSQYNQSGTLTGDLDGDGMVNFTDLNILLSNYNLPCGD